LGGLLYNYRHLFVIPAAGGAPRRLGAELDREMSNLAWSGDGSAVFGLVADRARSHVFRFSLADGKASAVLAGECRFNSLDLARNLGVFALAREDDNHPVEVFTASTDGLDLRQRTFLNEDWLAELRLGRTERISFRNRDGLTAEGFLTYPPNYDPGRAWPLILKIHGGPQGTDGNDFTAECQWYAANGFVVLRVNYRGSSDYGEAWMGAIRVHGYEKEFGLPYKEANFAFSARPRRLPTSRTSGRPSSSSSASRTTAARSPRPSSSIWG
jgi:dipeptidyl aminopeptidase/acylaminoacyl peptidase